VVFTTESQQIIGLRVDAVACLIRRLKGYFYGPE